METISKSIHDKVFSCDTKEDKKKLLKTLSIKAKERIELLGDDRNINQIVLSMYINDTHKEFNSFHQWRKKGFKVKKGSKAFFVWSKKREAVKKEENEEDKEYKFYTLAYLFSNAQVEPIKQSNNA